MSVRTVNVEDTLRALRRQCSQPDCAFCEELDAVIKAVEQVFDEASRCVSGTGDLKDLRSALRAAGGDA